MDLQYTILRGKIFCNEECVDIHFGLIECINGVYHLEVFLEDESLFSKYEFREEYELRGTTEKHYDISATNMRANKFKYSNNKMRFTVYGKISLKQQISYELPPNLIIPIYHVALDGFQMKHAHVTQNKMFRKGKEIHEVNLHNNDHTEIIVKIDSVDVSNKNFKLLFYNNENLKSLCIDFASDDQRIPYQDYLKFRNELRSFLSFINGGSVILRKEFTGVSYTSADRLFLNSQQVNLYSRNLIKQTTNRYLLINEHSSYTRKILPPLFEEGFHHFCDLYNRLDLGALVFSLNNADKTAGLDEKYFILITALERICNNFHKQAGFTDGTIVDDDFFNDQLKTELLAIVKKQKDKIQYYGDSAFQILHSRISQINRQKYSTTDKLFSFLSYAKIPLTKEIEKLVTIERHMAVHEGRIGTTDKERQFNFLKLDILLRDIVLNLINYTGPRNPVVNIYT